MAQPDLAGGARLPRTRTQRGDVCRRGDQGERAARRVRMPCDCLGRNRAAQRKAQNSKARISLSFAHEVFDDGEKVLCLARAERVSAAALSVTTKIDCCDVVAAPDEMRGQVEIFLCPPHAPEPGSEHEDLPRGAAPQRVRDRHTVGCAHTPVLSGTGERSSGAGHRSRHSTVDPAGRGPELAGTRIKAFARACAAMSWLPAEVRGSTLSTPPALVRMPSR